MMVVRSKESDPALSVVMDGRDEPGHDELMQFDATRKKP
jgi:hypothetical protein